MCDSLNDLKIKNVEDNVKDIKKEIKELKEQVKPVITLQCGFENLTRSVDKLSKQFEQFSIQNNNRNYQWLYYLITLIIGGIATKFLFK